MQRFGKTFSLVDRLPSVRELNSGPPVYEAEMFTFGEVAVEDV